MSAFQPYAGAYGVCDKVVRWRCYATARLHGLRRQVDAPMPAPPAGLKWLRPARDRDGVEVALLVDQAVNEVSQILLQIEAHPSPRDRPPV